MDDDQQDDARTATPLQADTDPMGVGPVADAAQFDDAEAYLDQLDREDEKRRARAEPAAEELAAGAGGVVATEGRGAARGAAVVPARGAVEHPTMEVKTVAIPAKDEALVEERLVKLPEGILGAPTVRELDSELQAVVDALRGRGTGGGGGTPSEPPAAPPLRSHRAAYLLGAGFAVLAAVLIAVAATSGDPQASKGAELDADGPAAAAGAGNPLLTEPTPAALSTHSSDGTGPEAEPSQAQTHAPAPPPPLKPATSTGPRPSASSAVPAAPPSATKDVPWNELP